MNNQVKLTDAEKVLEYIEDRIEVADDPEELYQLKCKIENGYFATYTPPVPTIKPGDTVRHLIYGTGIVIDVYKEQAVVDFDEELLQVNVANLEVVE